MRRRWFVVISAVSGFALVLLALAGESKITVEKNILYGKAGGEDLFLDMARPKEGGPFPTVVCVHGGGWISGHRSDLSKATEIFASKGFAAATISYRLAPKHKFPAQIEDCKAAVRFLRANADRFKLDTDRMGAVGLSAGGHLVCLLGTAFEGNGADEKHSSRVHAVVSFFGPTDFISITWSKLVEDTFLIPFLGGTPKQVPEQYRRSSPIIYASADDPPFLFFHGTKDPLVGIENSQKLAKKLQDVGVAAKLVTMDGDGHGWGGAKLQQSIDETLAFFNEKLKK